MINIEICDVTYTQDVIVADLSVDGVIGLDFMKKYKCTVDVPNGCFNVQGRRVKVDFVDKISCFRISIETVVIPARSEIIAYCSVEDMPHEYQDQQILGLIEPAEKFVKSGKALVASSVGYLKGGLIPVRMLNLLEDSQIVYPGTLVASLSMWML